MQYAIIMLDLQKDKIDSLTKDLSTKVRERLDELVIEGLKRKGFEFKTRFELITFMKNHCIRLDFLPEKKRVYLVDNEPFLMHHYKISVDPNKGAMSDLKSNMCSIGSFAFL